jgi:citrate synthase
MVNTKDLTSKVKTLDQSARLILPMPDNTEKEVKLPVIEGTEGERAIDVSELRAESGYITMDNGYMNTGSCVSSITFIDGEKGILRYRGYPIEQLVERSTFLETSYLLINGELPNNAELSKFKNDITRHSMIHESLKEFYGGFPRDAHPMAILASVVCSLSTFYQGEVCAEADAARINTVRLMAKLPTIIAYAYKKSVGQPFIYPDNSKSYCENFLYMMFGVPCEKYEVLPEMISLLDKLLIIHADHEQNCSTSAVRLVRSSLSNLYACIASGICALWGSRHGGANQSVIEMLQDIKASGISVSTYLEDIKLKKNNSKLMGFGHRVYKNFDPRALIIKQACHDLLKKLNKNDQLLDIALELEDHALRDEYFVERKLYPNVDFYSGILYKAMGIPVPAFPVMFALGRLPGWIAQALEYSGEPGNKIGRPRQIYDGSREREYPIK